MKIFVDSLVPGVVDGTEWTSICHRKDAFVWIRHMPFRELSRWTHAERKLPFMVQMMYRGRIGLCATELSAHKSLDAALKAAEKFVKEYVPCKA